jgi:hypothetical protein
METLIMAKRNNEEPSKAVQKHVQPFLDCVAYLLAKRWLRDQRRQTDQPVQCEQEAGRDHEAAPPSKEDPE